MRLSMCHSFARTKIMYPDSRCQHSNRISSNRTSAPGFPRRRDYNEARPKISMLERAECDRISAEVYINEGRRGALGSYFVGASGSKERSPANSGIARKPKLSTAVVEIVYITCEDIRNSLYFREMRAVKMMMSSV